jgi:hypothetical protein
MTITPTPVTHQDIKKIIKECQAQTKIEYPYKGSFFTPRFKSINHIEVGRSKIISNPITILIELGYVLFKDLRNWINASIKALFPRRQQLVGKKLTSTLKGRITFAPEKSKVPPPIHHMRVEFWARTWLLQWRKLGTDLTDDQGYYAIKFDPKAARSFINLSLRVEAYQTTHVYFKDGKAHPHYSLFHHEIIRKDDLRAESYMLETMRLHLWEYRTDYPTPRVVIKDREKDAPQYYSQARQDALAQQFIPYELTKAKHLEMLEMDAAKLTLDYIQQDYPINLSRCIERRLPGYTRSDSYFGNRQMNGMNRAAFWPDPEEKGSYWVKYFGSCQYETNQEFAFPDAEIKFSLDGEGLPSPSQIILTGPLTAYERDPWQKRSFTPADGESWNQAKRVARVSGSLCTEVDDHFTGTHLNTEQYAIAAYRNLRLNPVANLLLPHLKEVVLINHTADKLLLKEFLPISTALTSEGLKQRTKDILGMQDWKGFEPMKAISTAHEAAASDELFWKITKTYVEEFIDSHLEDIKTYWLEVYCFSQDLVTHSVPVFLSEADWEKMSPELKKHNLDRLHYYEYKYSFKPKLPRNTINGQLKAVSPITSQKNGLEVSLEDIQNLKESCTYMIFTATYLHTWINEHQYDELGELEYNGLGLRYGKGEYGIMAPESDLGIAPGLEAATKMLWFVNLLSRTEFGFITRNEEGDVNPAFSKLLMDHKEEFLRLGVEVENIESRTNI